MFPISAVTHCAARVAREVAARVAVESEPATKSERRRKKYHDDLAALLTAYLALHLTTEVYQRKMRALIQHYADLAYTDYFEDAPDEDAAQVKQSWVDEQQNFVAAFVASAVATQDLKDAEAEAAKQDLYTRIEAWDGSYQTMAGRLFAKSLGDPEIYYDGDDGNESCDECQQYKDEGPHPLSWWETRGLLARNGNDQFGCGRWNNCQHHYYLKETGDLIIP